MLKFFLLKTLKNHASKWLVLAIDLFLISFCFILSHYIRFADLSYSLLKLTLQLPIVIIIALFSFLLIGSYKGVIRHTGSKDVLNVFIALTISSGILITLVMLNRFFKISDGFVISRGVLFIYYLLSIFVLILSRYFFKIFYEKLTTDLKSIKNVLIYGAGDSGIITYGVLNSEKKDKFNVVGFIDDNLSKSKKKINRINIFTFNKIDVDFIEKNRVSEVIISIQNIEPNRLLEITDELLKLNVEAKIVPPISKWIDGSLQADQIRQINIDDLLGRQQIIIDNPIVKKEVNNKTILVTGAAGSIGSEISRQLTSYKYKKLILVDQAESALYDLQQELIQNGVTNFTVLVADVRDGHKMRKIFEEHSPERVFHAAAYKHVPLMENSPYEAICVNVLGTKNVADLSEAYNVERFVMISTDKAVNPTNVMGASKRIAELYISCMSAKKNNTKFTTTRFGNVLGSNGSVIPLFKKQIAKGGPLTVTHKEITRFFMTIPEACRLVLEAGTMGVGGEVYIFDMGKSIKIFNMAKRMISLSGFKYPDDIGIQITGLRPGEKLYEELLINGENTIKTYHEKIMIAKMNAIEVSEICSQINDLCNNISDFSSSEIVSKMKKLIPEYISNNSVFQKLDVNK